MAKGRGIHLCIRRVVPTCVSLTITGTLERPSWRFHGFRMGRSCQGNDSQSARSASPRPTASVGTFRTPKPIFSVTCLQLKHRLRASGSSSAASCSQYSRLLNFLLTERVGYISIMEHYFGLSLEIQILASSRRLPTQSGQQGLAGMENPIYILRQDHG